jgi:hypothetical protein
MTLSITMLCHYAECRLLFIIMLNAIILSVIMLSVVAPEPTFKEEPLRVTTGLTRKY